MVNQPDQLAEIGLPAQVNHSLQLRMMMPIFANLDELDLASEMVHYLLVSFRVPPLNRQIVLPSCRDNPERGILAGDFVDLGVPSLLLAGDMNVAPEDRGLYGQI